MSCRLKAAACLVSLIIPSATLANAAFFHILPTILQGRVSPGLYTATVLYLPFSWWAMVGRRARRTAPKSDYDCLGRWYLNDGERCLRSEMAQHRKLMKVARDKY
jgi:hypothetical protein